MLAIHISADPGRRKGERVREKKVLEKKHVQVSKPGRRKGERVREKEVLEKKHVQVSKCVYIYRFKKKVGQLGFKH